MSQTKLCRLCVKVCTDYASLYNETGQKNNICEITLKYFDPTFLNADQVPGSAVLCLECCGHISVFYNFQQAVFRAQRRLRVGERETRFEIKKEMREKLILDNKDNSQVPVTQDDSISLPDLELVEEFMFADTLQNKDNQDNSQTVNESKPLCENTKENEDTELSEDHPLSIPDTLESKKGSDSDDNQPTTTINRKRKQNINEPIPTCENTEEFGHKDDTVIINNFDTEQSKDQPISTSDTSKKGSDSHGNQPTTTIKRKLRRSPRLAPKDLDAVIAQRKESLECVVCKKYLANCESLSEHFRLEHPNEPIPMCENTEELGDKIIINNFDTEQSKYQPIITTHTSESEKGRDSDHNQPTTTIKRKRKQRQRSSFKDLDAVIAKWRPRLECVVCKKSLEHFKSLRLHFRLKHPNERCRVECCNRGLYTRCVVAKHARLHFSPDKVQCKHCDSYYVSRFAMYVHMSLVHSTASIEISDKIGNSKLRRKSNIECVICKTSCANFSLLKVHYRLKHPTEVCYALCCERKFYWPNRYEEHARIHRDPNAYTCKKCGKRLCRSDALREHMQLHRDPNAFTCKICCKSLCRSQALKRHIRLCHSNIETADP